MSSSSDNIHPEIVHKLDYFYDTQKIPNIIIHGASGTGKRTIIHNFLNKIYQGDKSKMKMNVMMVNCAHGKGIKFIRDELKFFAKTNIQTGVSFKSIVLLNADYLTIDAQSALRRCIELFSHNTRFFIVVENMNRLLNPILSRFCAIYVPEHIVDDKVVNLHQVALAKKYPASGAVDDKKRWFNENMERIFSQPTTPQILSEFAGILYERGYSCFDVIDYVESSALSRKADIILTFHHIRKEYRCEKMLMFYVFMEMAASPFVRSLLL